MATVAGQQDRKGGSMARIVIASSAGTAFEWYDFFIFGSLAPVISKVFFAGLDATQALIAALALFAAGFAFRPLGALIFGVVGDKLGRKGAFLITVSLMGGATFLIGLLPTYAQAGSIAAVLLIILRILQGVALGGEYGGAAIYVAEHAPANKRGASTGWIQSSASFGLLAALLVIVATRTAVGEDAFNAWGWRIPFLVSAILLAISVWMRAKLTESPEFARLREEGDVAHAPLREAFGKWRNLRQVLIAFFGIMCAQGAVWYFTFFYMQVFLERSLGLPAATKDLLLIVMTVVSAPLYVYFGWLSDRVGRKPVMVGGMLLALVLYFPASHWIAGAANPALVEAQRATPVFVETDPATCSVQFDPVGTAKFVSPCDIAKSSLVTKGISFATRQSKDAQTRVIIGTEAVPIEGGQGLSAADLKALKAKTSDAIGAELQEAGYPKSADPRSANMTLLILILLLFVVAATALYGPQASALVEMFPTRVRYTAMSFPYHVGTGWVGGFLPVTSFALVAITGNIYEGLWYAVVFTAISVVVSLLFLKETAGKHLREV
jgi:MFS family permease